MCRSIKVLNRPDEPVTTEELQKAALQFVRKISGYNKPSRANQEAFERAVREVAESSQRLLGTIVRTPSRSKPVRSESPAVEETVAQG